MHKIVHSFVNNFVVPINEGRYDVVRIRRVESSDGDHNVNDESPVLYPSDSVPDKAFVREQLATIEPIIRDCIIEAFRTLQTVTEIGVIVADALDYMRTRPKLMNSFVVAYVRREFGRGVEGVKIIEENGFVELRVNDIIDLRFKLVDEVGRSCNAKTDAQKRYRNELPLLGDDVLDAIRLTVGWRWNETATDLVGITVSFEKGDDPAWVYSLLDDAGDSGAVISVPKPDDGPAPARVRVRGRKSVADKKRG